MNCIFNSHITGFERELCLIESECDTKLARLNCLMEMVERDYEVKCMVAEHNVFVENGTYDDLSELYTEAKQEKEKKSGNILSAIIAAVGQFFSTLGNWINEKILGNGKDPGAIDGVPEKLSISDKFLKIFGFLEKAWKAWTGAIKSLLDGTAVDKGLTTVVETVATILGPVAGMGAGTLVYMQRDRIKDMISKARDWIKEGKQWAADLEKKQKENEEAEKEAKKAAEEAKNAESSEPVVKTAGPEGQQVSVRTTGDGSVHKTTVQEPTSKATAAANKAAANAPQTPLQTAQVINPQYPNQPTTPQVTTGGATGQWVAPPTPGKQTKDGKTTKESSMSVIPGGYFVETNAPGTEPNQVNNPATNTNKPSAVRTPNTKAPETVGQKAQVAVGKVANTIDKVKNVFGNVSSSVVSKVVAGIKAFGAFVSDWIGKIWRAVLGKPDPESQPAQTPAQPAQPAQTPAQPAQPAQTPAQPEAQPAAQPQEQVVTASAHDEELQPDYIYFREESEMDEEIEELALEFAEL